MPAPPALPTVLGSLTALLLTAPAVSQEGTFDRPAQKVPAAAGPAVLLSSWRSAHGSSWQARANPQTGSIEMLFGGTARPPFAPDTSVEQDWFDLARFWIGETHAMHGVDDVELRHPRFTYLPLAQSNTTDKIAVRYEQVMGDVPVEQGHLNLLFDTRGWLLSLQTTAAPTVADESDSTVIDAGFANLVAADAFKREYGVEPTAETRERLVHAWVDGGEVRTWQLAWQVDTTFEQRGTQPLGRRYTIDAETGEVLKSDNTVHNVDVFGTVSSHATPGLSAGSAANPPTIQPMPRVRIRSSGATIETDKDGNFNMVGVNVPIDLTVDYYGPYTDVNNDAGLDYTVTFQDVLPNQQNDLLMNPNPSEFVTAQANTQLHINAIRDFIVDRFPTDPTANFRATAVVNQNSTCNAFFVGDYVAFFRSGNGCRNTAFSSVVAHEMGHWFNQLYGTGNGSDGMGEGNADVFAMYAHDDPVVGRDFYANGNAVRTGENLRQFCGDNNPGCYGGAHDNGEVWMGAAWKVRSQLNASLGDARGDLTSDLLFLGWMNAFDQTTIRSIIEEQWLVLDDDNGDLSDGTPNFMAIDAGFVEQGFPGYDFPFLTVDNVIPAPNTSSETGLYRVTANVRANLGTQVARVDLRYTVNGGPEMSVPMTGSGGTSFIGGIPGQNSPALVRYAIEATDSQGNVELFPETGVELGLDFSVGVTTPLLATDFEAGTQGWVSGAAGDTASEGAWTLGDPIGTAAQPEDDTTDPGVSCWFTGQGVAGGGVAAADVDGGRTSLTSPVFDAGDAEILLLRYSQWFSTNQGATTQADRFTVLASGDSGGSWRLVHRIDGGQPTSEGGWVRATYDLTSVIVPTATMRLRFIADDGFADSVVEAAVDDIRVTSLAPSSPPTNYCSTAPNSTGLPASIRTAGSRFVADNAFSLIASAVPNAQFGLFFFGPMQADLPFPTGAGRLCVGGNLRRLPVVQSDPFFGTAFYALDFTDTQTTAPLIRGGSRWNFQFWFRDSVGGQATSNTTDGITVLFYD